MYVLFCCNSWRTHDPACHSRMFVPGESWHRLEIVPSQLVSSACLLHSTHTQLRVLRGCSAPPTISPLTTRSGRKRKLQKPNTEVCHLTLKLFVLTDVFHSPPILFSYSHQPNHGLLNVSMVTGWFSDVLHHFITVKWVTDLLQYVIFNQSHGLN